MIQDYPVGSILGEEEIDAVRRVIDSGQTLTRGPEVGAFEKEFAKYVGVKHAVATSSCTGALRMAAQILGLKEGDEVIVQDNAFWATYCALVERGVVIKCADIVPESLNIDYEGLEKLITPKTRAIYLMHHGGNPAELQTVLEIAEENDLRVVEDAAHAVGAEYRHEKIGGHGDLTCFSFSTMKNMVTLGEGGAICTNNDEYAEMARGLRTCYPYGRRVKRDVPELGMYHKPKSVAFMHAGDAWDYDWLGVDEVGSAWRMSEAQAAVGRVQLKKLDKFIKMRARIAGRYDEEVWGYDGLIQLDILPHCKHAWHLYSFFCDPEKVDRDRFVEEMKKNGVEITLRFWPIHLGGILRGQGHKVGECPVNEGIWFREQLALPIAPQMTDIEVEMVCDAIGESLKC